MILKLATLLFSSLPFPLPPFPSLYLSHFPLFLSLSPFPVLQFLQSNEAQDALTQEEADLWGLVTQTGNL